VKVTTRQAATPQGKIGYKQNAGKGGRRGEEGSGRVVLLKGQVYGLLNLIRRGESPLDRNSIQGRPWRDH